MSTGLPASASWSITSKNDLNRPLYEAVKIGVTAIRPSACVTASIAPRSAGPGKPATKLCAISVARSRSSITVTSTGPPCAPS